MPPVPVGRQSHAVARVEQQEELKLIDPVERERLSEEIVAWLEQERRAYAEVARKVGVSPSSVTQKLVGRFDGNSLRYEWEERITSPMLDRNVAIGLSLARGESRPESSERIADALFNAYGERCRIFWLRMFHRFDDDPVGTVRDHLLGPTSTEYLASLRSLEEPNEPMARDCAERLLAVIEADELVTTWSLPVGGIDFEGECELGRGMKVRRLTPEELGDLFETRSFGVLLPTARFAATWDAADERWVIEVSVRHGRDEQADLKNRLQRIVLALALLGFEPHGRGYAPWRQEPGIYGPGGGQHVDMATHGATLPCSLDVGVRAVALADRIPESFLHSPRNRQEVALHRFSLAASHRSPTESLIDFVISMEALLLGRSRGEHRYRFGLYGAHFIGSSEPERASVFGALREVYDTRSTLVHGAAQPSPTEIVGLAQMARMLAGRMLVRALEEGWPSADYLHALTLRG